MGDAATADNERRSVANKAVWVVTLAMVRGEVVAGGAGRAAADL